MVALIFEILGAVNVVAASYYWATDKDDIMHWLFFLLFAVIMYLNADRYDKVT